MTGNELQNRLPLCGKLRNQQEGKHWEMIEERDGFTSNEGKIIKDIF